MNKDLFLNLYKKLLLVRMCEEKIIEEYKNNEMKTPVHLGIGAEAIPVGTCSALPSGFKAFGTYRNHALYLTMTENTSLFFAELYGKVTGSNRGKAGSMHLSAPEVGLIATSAVVSTTIPVAVGAAFAEQYKGTNNFVIVFFGDGAVEEGVFWESLNFAALKKLKIIFVCEDNNLAIHTETKDRQGFKSIEDIPSLFNFYTAQIPGHDLLELYKSTSEMVESMEKECKPGFIHTKYFRLLEHVGPNEDFAAGYRLKPPIEELKKIDPILCLEEKFKIYSIDPNQLSAIRDSINIKIEDSIEFAKQSPFPNNDQLLADIYI